MWPAEGSSRRGDVVTARAAAEATDKGIRAGTVLETLQRASRHAQGVVETGVTTTRQLQVQGEQMRRVDRGLDEVKQELGAGDHALLRMTWAGRIKSWFKPTPPQPSNRGLSSSVLSPSSAQPPEEQLGQKRQGQETRGRDPHGVSSDGRDNQLSKEEEELLDALLGDVHVMREQATLQRAILTDHSCRLGAMTTKTDEVCNHMERMNRKVEKML
ncbi:hypothetical protein TraAM80_08903 [Trypanosoma rangeli]|uniref:t-SNARE coiled-coil homology domain-containing protein n=1 Tax=Trypanosoma rangeli TaxID=5698 RepID=A0A422MYD1_TRYRA|nr:uncharacterized protein TraAM80_08903 [Trypanosoma rangeli]RNE98232.1 hypothetical protein TraAM80_08903 [Trypanosoma rangeli]|eukprot:RNE98232.1 hypothetical protein TraAM80_08903 [Trypanosoma rangeli]